MAVILPAPVYNSVTNTEYEVPAETLQAVDDFVVPNGYRREGARESSFMYSLGVYVEPIDSKSKACKYFCLASAPCRSKKQVVPCTGRDRANVNKHLKRYHNMAGQVSMKK